MQYVLWTLVSLIAYVGGLLLIARVTPVLLLHSFDEGVFMGVAALEILGALLALGSVVVMYALFNGAFPIRVLNFFLLVGILLVTLRMSLFSFRSRAIRKTFSTSRIIAGSFCLLLAAAAVFYITQLFINN